MHKIKMGYKSSKQINIGPFSDRDKQLLRYLYLLEIHWFANEFIIFWKLFSRRQLNEDFTKLTSTAATRQGEGKHLKHGAPFPVQASSEAVTLAVTD